MLKVSELVGRRVLVPKAPKKAKDGTVTKRYQKLGKVRTAVFSPGGKLVVGLMVKRPDVAGMVQRPDAFVALDSFDAREAEVLVTRPEDGMDDAAIKRLGLDWDACILWSGMDAKTVDGKSLGYVSDAEFNEKNGRVERFSTTDGGFARALLGSFVIRPDMVRGYRDGFMVIDPGSSRVELDGGLAGAAGEGYARVRAGASEVGKKAGAVAGEAVDKGSFALGRALGKAKRAIAEATAEEQAAPEVPAVEAAEVHVSKPVEGLPAEAAPAPAQAERERPKTYAPAPEGSRPAAASRKAPAKKAPATKKAPAKKAPATSDRVARAAGKQLSSFGKMFGSFKEEFDKASK